ncbi:MAG: 2-oxoglutarate dehydrogenase complex dihydrolipoyllysine-residue succinyltransferase [Planctomycetaceae bacterium]|nr:MAG: 2-oxoglutarate dehydrogenase complex dihydrolipoyllysine-residue succinyltransferase [Planctomycetaceae bacterium]
MIEVTVPEVGESITEVQIGQWLKAEGDWVNQGEDLVEIETEKASVQIPATTSGYLRQHLKQAEEFAVVGEVIAMLEPADAGSAPPPREPTPATSPAAKSAPSAVAPPTAAAPVAAADGKQGDAFVMPAAQRLIDDLQLDASRIPATGPGGRLLKEDVQRFVASTTSGPAAASTRAPAAAPVTPDPALRTISAVGELAPETTLLSNSLHRSEELKPMSMMRRTIAARLVQAQQTAALLTTFNEVDMQPVMALRNKYRDAFAQKHGVKLGFMSFFAKAAVEALRRFPAVNAEIRGSHIAYRNYQDIGIAIGGGKGLVVPILRNVERLSFADIERQISDYAVAAGDNRIQPQDLEGGTFTISNGGIYGSLLSTPIVNPPQSGILGLHSIQERPIALNGQVVIRPMMYLALTYDHRIVDGREAVSFLKTIKDVIEDPARLFLEV